MKYFVVLNRPREAAIRYPCHRLPKYLHQPDATEVTVPLLDNKYGLPFTLFRVVTFAIVDLDQSDNHHPIRGVRQFLPRCGPLPGSKMLCPHAGWSTIPVYSWVVNLPGHPLLPQHQVVNWNRSRSTGMLLSGGRTLRYSSTRYAVILALVNLSGGGRGGPQCCGTTPSHPDQRLFYKGGV